MTRLPMWPLLLVGLPALLCIFTVVAAGCGGVGAARSDDGPGAPTHLRCEYQANPLGLDVPRPRLSWHVSDDRRGARQSAYQVRVASSAKHLADGQADRWDSGKVASDASHLVPYGGKPLGTGTTCFWQVRTWDADGKPSPWSDIARWEMGVMDSKDWSARWISSPQVEMTQDPKQIDGWYWHPDGAKDNQAVYFRTAIELPGDPDPHHTKFYITADNRYTLFVNGEKAAEGSDFKTLDRHILFGGKKALQAGRNVIAIAAANADGPAGLAAGVTVTLYGGKQIVVPLTDWRCSTEAAENWQAPDFKADGWVKAAKVGPFGGGVWGEIDTQFDGPRRSFMLRKGVTLKGDVRRARAYVTGLGWYELSINGKRIDEDLFTPGWTQYEKRLQYQTYDVTDLLADGNNTIGAVLGNGWWSSGLGWAGGHVRHAAEGENLRFLCQIVCEMADGSTRTIVTDPTWKTHASPILEDTIYHGVTYDARLAQPGWNRPGFDAADWQFAIAVEGHPFDQFCAQRGPTVRVTEVLKPVRVTEPKPGVYVLDYGQNHAGRPRLTVRAKAGTEITLRHAEILRPDGCVDQINLRSARATDRYICRGGGQEVWSPRFTYHGARYVQVTGLPKPPDKETVVSEVLHTAPPPAGTFTCSNDLVNRILTNVRWGLRSNLHSVPTDCPQRDERLGWMGDAQAFAPTACWLHDTALFWTKWSRDIADAQHENGATTGVSPTIVVQGYGRSAWADAVTVIPWVTYLYYGDTGILAENYEPMKAWVEHMRVHLTEGLYLHDTWGDWVPVVPTPTPPVSAAYGYYSTALLAKMAAALGKKTDAAEYARLAESMAEAYQKKFYDADAGAYRAGTQTANLLPLAFGITPPEARQTVADAVAKDVVEHGGHHTTGFLGTPVILPTLANYGRPDLAWQITATDAYPSLGYMVAKGATTIWERWNTDTEGPGMNSRNHFAFGSMAQWLFEGVAGLQPDPSAPGFKHTIIRPYVVGDLEWAEASQTTPYGELTSRWERKDGDLRLAVTVPANATATLHAPTADAATITEGGRPVGEAPGLRLDGTEGDRTVLHLDAGTYTFVVKSAGKAAGE